MDPLAPLSAADIETVIAVLREQEGLEAHHRFVRVDLVEPDKADVERWRPGDRLDRRGLAVVFDRAKNLTYEAVVSITDRVVRSFVPVPGVQPEVMLDEFDAAERAVKDSALFRQALAKRGITDVEALCVDPWSAGSYGSDDRDRRLMRALVWVRMDGPTDNQYAHPLDNLVAIVDLNTMEVIEVEDHGVVPVPKEPGNYSPEVVGGARTDLRPLDISQPDGPSFELSGHTVTWQKWRFRIGFTQREGLVLHTVAYRDGDEWRSILHRAALSSMLVPYGDPRPAQFRKNAFDSGEYGLGYLANSLELGCDCLGEIRYIDATLCDPEGRPYTIANAVCLHEEDDGILWKHMDFRTEYTEVRRSRRLVVSYIATVGNYEYGFYWRFYQDGSIEHEIRLTGILSTAAVAPGERPPSGQLLNPEGLYGAVHQHFFNYRLDFDLDGVDNAVYEVDTVAPERGPDNPHGNAHRAVETLLRSESEAQRLADSSRDRFWKVVNHGRRNKVGEPTAYRLVPRSATLPYWHGDAHIAPRGAFCSKHLWVTAHDPSELYAAGAYPYQNPDPGGLPEWTGRDRDLVDTDVVVWYTFGSHHVPRLEDWPVMPVQHVGFRLEPCGFFDQNPALDVAPPKHRC
jgi:primary-amine oxidase